MNHPRHQLDAIIHNATRFSIMAALLPADKAEFKFIRDTVEITDSVLSQHVTALEQAGYVKVTKGQVGRRPRTWLSATRAGRAAFHAHLAVLNQLANWSPTAQEHRAST
ncbi:winged helix-turn-helix domain-containing protein [Actinopolymorpha alba]|uniref:winged helix-turn-helix domain-containing protein n=1 Tax=Actinopolymorpha alba TaxID=533267 RepID=UPI000371BD07|nr:transcriptional regulator [Actinopolymorpha alba]